MGKKLRFGSQRGVCGLVEKPGTDSAARPVNLSRRKTRIPLLYLAKMLHKNQLVANDITAVRRYKALQER